MLTGRGLPRRVLLVKQVCCVRSLFGPDTDGLVVLCFWLWAATWAPAACPACPSSSRAVARLLSAFEQWDLA